MVHASRFLYISGTTSIFPTPTLHCATTFFRFPLPRDRPPISSKQYTVFMAGRHQPVWGFLMLALLVCTVIAEDATPISTPAGFTPFLEVLGAGVQIYKCQGSGSSFSWVQMSAKARLYPAETKHLSKKHAVGEHYFLQQADALGGRPTWSLDSSTVTGRVNGTKASGDPANISDLLLEATAHSGTGPLSLTAYIQRLRNKGGAAPVASRCSSTKHRGRVARVPYRSHYVFLSQDTQPPTTAPAAPSGHPLLGGYFGEGFQHYRFNGSAWVFFNATAGLLVRPGGSLVGTHFFLPQPDAANGQATFELVAPASRVTAKATQVVPASSPDIPHVLLQATSVSGSKYGVANVSYIRRLSTKGGSAPAVAETDAQGDVYLAPYSAVYWFYASRTV